MQGDVSIWDLAASLISTKTDKANVIVGAVMVTTPLWLQYLKAVSDVAAMLAPILGCVFVGLQIYQKVRRKK